MSAYKSLLRAVPAMRFYDKIADMAPKSEWAGKRDKVKAMGSKKVSSSSVSKPKPKAKSESKAEGRPKVARSVPAKKVAGPKSSVKSKAPVRGRRGGYKRRSLLNV